MIPKTDTSRNKGFYGWIALSGAVLALLSSNAFLQPYGVFLPVISNEFGWSRAAVAAALSFAQLALGLPGPLLGILTTRFGPRINIILGNALAALALAGLYFLHDLWYLYLLFFIVGLGSGIGGYIPITAVAVNWFTKKVSLAIGIISSAVGLAGFIFPPLATVLIAAVGWRITWVILGGIILIGATVIGGIVMVRNRPEDTGQVPDGVKVEPIKPVIKTQNYPEKDEILSSWPLKKLLRMPVTWYIFFLGISNSAVVATMISHQVAYVQDLGFSPLNAATTMSITAIARVLTSLAFGALALRINIRYLAISAFIIQLVGMAILLTSRELGWLYIFSALVGIGSGVISPAFPTFIGVYYGRHLYARVMGIAFTLQVLASAAAGTIAGIIFDARNSYTLAFIIVVVFILIGLVSVFLARKPKLMIDVSG
jgi:MFS family permease